MKATQDIFHNTIKQSPGLLLTARGRLLIGAVFIVLGISAIALSDMISVVEWWLHGVWCIFGMLITIPALVKALRVEFEIVLRNHFVMFTAFFSLYFLFGAAFLTFGPEDSVSNSLRYYTVMAKDALWVDAINSIGFGIALITGAISTGSFLAANTDRVAVIARKVPVHIVIMIFILVGLIARFNVLYLDFGFREGIISGVWRSASNFTLIAILLASSFRGKYERFMLLVSILLTMLEIVAGLLLFNKSLILISVGLLIAGLSLRYKSRKVIFIGLVVMVLLLISIVNIIAYSRNNLSSETGAFTSRSQVLIDGFATPNAEYESSEFVMWARLCYVPSQNAARNFYDSGTGGDDIQLIPWVFVPRFLAPNKPVMTDAGVELNTKISGLKGSSTGQGIFFSGYYNSGWIGLILVSILCGWILSQTSAIANVIMSSQAFLLLPFVWSGVYIAFRLDGHFLSDYLGAFTLIVYPIMILSLIFSIRRSTYFKRKRTRL